ncbi:MAG: hypothetical protein C4518_15040 [Desulfobacteraceae bacterium]|nr:MAG: hypothetical protein C4518_15040 [Desulfobacteraceae bacterium]
MKVGPGAHSFHCLSAPSGGVRPHFPTYFPCQSDKNQLPPKMAQPCRQLGQRAASYPPAGSGHNPLKKRITMKRLVTRPPNSRSCRLFFDADI